MLDPFAGTGTTLVAALRAERNSIGVEIDQEYCRMAAQRLREESNNLFSSATLLFQKLDSKFADSPSIRKAPEIYETKSIKSSSKRSPGARA